MMFPAKPIVAAITKPIRLVGMISLSAVGVALPPTVREVLKKCQSYQVQDFPALTFEFYVINVISKFILNYSLYKAIFYQVRTAVSFTY